MNRGGMLRCTRYCGVLLPTAVWVVGVPTSLVTCGLQLPRAAAQTRPAEPNTLDTRLELELPLGCGTLAVFVERLRSRSARIRFADQGANRTVLARVTAETDGTYRATMTLLYPDGHSSSRIIEASSCNEAIEALALVTAVALDPLSMETSPRPATPRPAGQPMASLRHDEPKIPAVRTTEPAAKPAPPPSRETLLGLGVAFASHRGQSPGWLNGFEPNLRLMSTRRSAFSPSVRLGFSYTENRGNSLAGGIADFALASLTVDLCPWQMLSQSFELRSCALAHAGIVFAEGRATSGPESHLRQYWALGTSAEVVFVPVSSIGVPLRASAAIPLVRDTYAFNHVPFYRVPAVAFGITAGLEVRFR